MHNLRPLQALRDLSYILQRSAIITHLAGGQKDKTGSIQDGYLCQGKVHFFSGGMCNSIRIKYLVEKYMCTA